MLDWEPGDRAWISAPNFINMWDIFTLYSALFYRGNTQEYHDFVISIADGSNDVNVIVKAIMDWFLPSELLEEQDYQNAIDIFKLTIPDNYFTDGIWTVDFDDVPKQIRILMNHIIRQPEFYLK